MAIKGSKNTPYNNSTDERCFSYHYATFIQNDMERRRKFSLYNDINRGRKSSSTARNTP